MSWASLCEEPTLVSHIMDAWKNAQDGAGHSLVTAYAVQRPDGQWSIMLVTKDQRHAQTIHLAFNAHLPVADEGIADLETPASADPDHPPVTSTVDAATAAATYTLPPASTHRATRKDLRAKVSPSLTPCAPVIAVLSQ